MKAGTHCTGNWVSPKAGHDGCEKSHPPPGFDPRTVQLVASRYVDYVISLTVNNETTSGATVKYFLIPTLCDAY